VGTHSRDLFYSRSVFNLLSAPTCEEFDMRLSFNFCARLSAFVLCTCLMSGFGMANAANGEMGKGKIDVFGLYGGQSVYTIVCVA
jgi:hypothetical protein